MGWCAAAARELREQLRALEGTGGRLFAANSEMADKLNAQAGQLAALQAELAQARAGGPAGGAPQNPAGAPTRMEQAHPRALLQEAAVMQLTVHWLHG